MAESIQAGLDHDKLQVLRPGDTATSELTITNAGTTPDRYRMEMEGLPPSWCQLVYVDAVVAPRQRHTARLVVRTPATASAEVYEFTLSVLSANDPEQRTRVKGTLQIGEIEAIGVSLQATQLQIPPEGGAAQTTVTIENRGTILDRYVLEVAGLEPSWYRLSDEGEIPIGPGTTKEVTLVVSPPPGGGVKGGRYAFTITARSRVDLNRTGRAQAMLQVAERAEYTLSLDPGKVTGRKGSYKVIADNTGNTDFDLTLDATDTKGACDFTVTPSTVHLAHGQKETVSLVVTAPRSNLFGKQKSYRFQVTGKTSQGQSRMAPGEFVHSPLVHPGRTLLIIPLLAAGLALLAGGYPPVRSLVTGTVCERVQLLCSSILYTRLTRTINGFPQPDLLGRGLDHPSAGVEHTTLQTTTNGLIVDDSTHHRVFFIPKDTVIYQYQAGVATLLTGPHLLLGHTLPVDPALPISGTIHQYDATTRHNLEQPILDFWKLDGEVNFLGRPQTEPFCEQGGRTRYPELHPESVSCARGWTLVQYTDRFKLDVVHGKVAIAPLGKQLTADLAALNPAFNPVSRQSCAPGAQYFPHTQHCVADTFLSYLLQRPTISQLLGSPISEQTPWTDTGASHQSVVQWFENGRLEIGAAAGNTVELSTLGLESLRQRGWLPPAP
jgi:hypothetical protein